MSDVVYHTPDGLQVILEAWNWTQHIKRRHPELDKTDVQHALTMPTRICDHLTEDTQRIYEGLQRQAGFHRGEFPIVVVELTGVYAGRVITAYLTTLPYRGIQRWP